MLGRVPPEQGEQVALPAGRGKALAGKEPAQGLDGHEQGHAHQATEQDGQIVAELEGDGVHRGGDPGCPRLLPELDGHGVYQVDAEGQPGQGGEGPPAAPALPIGARQQEQGRGQHGGKEMQIALDALVVDAGAAGEPEGAGGDDGKAGRRHAPQRPPAGELLQPGQPGAQKKVAQIAAHKVQIQRPVDGEGALPGAGGGQIAEGVHADGGNQPQAHQVVPVGLAQPIGHLFEQRRDQIDGHQGVQEPVGHHHRRVEQGNELVQGGLGAGEHAGQGDDDARPGQQGDQHFGQAAAKQGAQLRRPGVGQEQRPGEHEEQGHRRRGQGGEQVGEVPQGGAKLAQGACRGVEVDHPHHGGHPQQIVVPAASGQRAHRPTAFRRRRDRGGAWTGSLRRKGIWGFRASRMGRPSPSVRPSARKETGRTPGPTSSSSSPSANLLRSSHRAAPSGAQEVTTPTTCQSRR